MTELITEDGKLYLATCIDLATREVVGWALADHHRAELPVAALRLAAGRGRLEAGCIMHADRGSEYTSSEFRSMISELGMKQSIGRVGSCYDNAAAESWFALFKAEIGTTVWATRAQESKSSAPAVGSAGTPILGISPRSRPGPDCSATSPPQRRNPLSKVMGKLQIAVRLSMSPH